MKIPYGLSNFADVRKRGFFYVDKTPFLPLLESGESGYSYLVFLRPRRMGKSLLISMLEYYYDLARAPQFNELFGGLWVHSHPTPERNSYIVLNLDFSAVATDRGPDVLLRTFFLAVKQRVFDTLSRYRESIPEFAHLLSRLDDYCDPEALMGALISLMSSTGNKLYVLIDEYDNFANKILSDDAEDLYSAVVERTGFVRTFYATMKAGTAIGAIGRFFVTGITPILLDDLSSGFNIITHISNQPRFNALAGFTREDVDQAVDGMFRSSPHLDTIAELKHREALAAVLVKYYNGYRFSVDATARIFNSDMVLYFLRELENQGRRPSDMLDRNVRTDYGRLQHIGKVTGTVGEERRAIYEEVLTHGFVWARLIEQFGTRGASSRDQFISFLYYLGLLTLSPLPQSGREVRLEIPNQVVHDLQWEHLSLQLKDTAGMEVDTHPIRSALRKMAVEGTIEPFLSLFHEQVVKGMGVKDLRQFSEKTLKLMFMTCLVMTGIFHPLSEKEFAQGYCDLFLSPSGLVGDSRFAWMLEFKYIPTGATKNATEKAFEQADEQLSHYASDKALVEMLSKGQELRAGALVFVGSKQVLFRPWPSPTKAARRVSKRR